MNCQNAQTIKIVENIPDKGIICEYEHDKFSRV